ncbi:MULTISPECIES: cyclic-di-AMP receptor [unclassified Lactobacillus]|uniref:cyclic-di-AMP receptor n=1 Tax=unclassified Lactobacillus TaxID=2620435 RepID=UPI0023F75279|nr:MULTISPECIES: cyclic-di-AMP receptor [unclassified Lactobacillus]MDF7669040.1 cyclic-di-AMP receptor [Lactobacillus sp. ESL0703]WEV38268.1 cyclic-di-AMP receptor [Lactobacillus sp. ESL0680]
MKLIIAIVQKEDASRLQRTLVKENIRATKLATTGGFLSQGNTTFLIGIDDEHVKEVLHIIKEESKAREEYMNPNMVMTGFDMSSQPIKITVGGATCFVLPVEAFKQF